MRVVGATRGVYDVSVAGMPMHTTIDDVLHTQYTENRFCRGYVAAISAGQLLGAVGKEVLLHRGWKLLVMAECWRVVVC